MLYQPEFRTLRALNGDEMSTGSRLKATGRCVWSGQPLGKTPSFCHDHLLNPNTKSTDSICLLVKSCVSGSPRSKTELLTVSPSGGPT